MSNDNRSSSGEHRHKTKEEVIKINRTRVRTQKLAVTMFWLAVVTLLVYTVHRFFPFLKSISFYRKINVSSITYILLRVTLILIPLSIVMPLNWYKQYIRKTTLIMDLYAVSSFLYFFGMVADVFSYNLLGGYIDDGSDPILLKLLWNVTDKSGVLYCFAMGLLHLIMSKKFIGHKKDVVIIHALIFVVSCVIPLAYSFINGSAFTGKWFVWFGKNIYFFISNLLMFIGFLLSSSSRWIWGTVIWG